jgi:hypothetical protein
LSAFSYRPAYHWSVAERVACVRCGAEGGIRLPDARAAVVTCAACEAEQPARDYLSPMARLKRATSTNQVPKVEVGMTEDLRHQVDERKARRKLVLALGIGIPVVAGIVAGIAMLT